MESASIDLAGRGRALHYVPADELERIRALDADPIARAAAFADACRINVLYMVARAGSGHIGTSFSCIDLLAWLHLEVLGEGDRYFSSKGHDAPALYAVLTALGRIDFDGVHELRRLGGLPGHPDAVLNPEVVTSTGSLGMGISKAKGFVHADRLLGRSGSVFVLTGDGELQEGQFWESLPSAANQRLGEITAIVDHNKIQSDTWVSEVSDLGDLEARVRACGWAVGRCDGNDIGAVSEALAALGRDAADRPKLLIADTVKGSGVSFMEPRELPQSGDALYPFHSGAPSASDYDRALAELSERLTARLDQLASPPPALAQTELEAAPASPPAAPQSLIGAYGEALADAGADRPELVALDADLYLDTGLIPFRRRFPERFYECGIAEQDMVSQAGAMARSGLLPVVHSFACFLSARPNEQIYTNATEASRVVYVGSLAGLVPGGPGHSHQAVRDISALGTMPGMALLEPYCEQQVRQALDWSLREATGSVYLRLVSVPWELGFEPPDAPLPPPGRGTVLREGGDALFVAAGPVMVSQAWGAAELLAAEGAGCAVVALPWLRDLDGDWLAEQAAGAPIICLDNHYATGGQGDAVLAALAEAQPQPAGQVRKVAVTEVPRCGSNEEVLRAHGLDAEGIAARVRTELHVGV